MKSKNHGAETSQSASPCLAQVPNMYRLTPHCRQRAVPRRRNCRDVNCATLHQICHQHGQGRDKSTSDTFTCGLLRGSWDSENPHLGETRKPHNPRHTASRNHNANHMKPISAPNYALMGTSAQQIRTTNPHHHKLKPTLTSANLVYITQTINPPHYNPTHHVGTSASHSRETRALSRTDLS